MSQELVDRELMLNRFKRLLGEVARGVVARNSFQPWELELLWDIEACSVEQRQRLAVLRQYEKSVERQLSGGPGPPMKLSEYLQTRRPRVRPG